MQHSRVTNLQFQILIEQKLDGVVDIFNYSRGVKGIIAFIRLTSTL